MFAAILNYHYAKVKAEERAGMEAGAGAAGRHHRDRRPPPSAAAPRPGAGDEACPEVDCEAMCSCCGGGGGRFVPAPATQTLEEVDFDRSLSGAAAAGDCPRCRVGGLEPASVFVWFCCCCCCCRGGGLEPADRNSGVPGFRPGRLLWGERSEAR